jgi:hypothetical protein
MIHAMVIVVVHILHAPGPILQHDQSCCAFPTNTRGPIQLVLEPKQVALLVLQVKLQLLWKTKLLKE